MGANSLTPETLDAIAEEHEVLDGLYERILTALQTLPRENLIVSKLLEELAERLAEHFVHEQADLCLSDVLKEEHPIQPQMKPQRDDRHPEMKDTRSFL